MRSTISFGSQHFRLEQLADGIYAALHADGGWAQSNAGIIDLGNRTLVFDTLLTPEAAADLQSAAESLTGRPVDAVINSHYHNDHIWGNQVYPADIDIISTTKTRELITTRGAEEDQWFRDYSQQRLDTLVAQRREARDEVAQALLAYTIIYYQAIIATLPKLQIRLPNITFTEGLTFMGSKRSAELITYGGGHTGSDAILYLPDDGIVFMADLLFIDVHPWLPDGDPGETRRILARVRNLHPKTLVPGHGPVGQISHLDAMVEYIDTLDSLVREAVTQGVAEQDIDKITMPRRYERWIFPSFFPANLKFLYQRQMSARVDAAN